MRENFAPEKGAKAQEYFVYFKLLQRIYGANFPQSAADDIVRCCLSMNIRAGVIIELRRLYGCSYDEFFFGLDAEDKK